MSILSVDRIIETFLLNKFWNRSKSQNNSCIYFIFRRDESSYDLNPFRNLLEKVNDSIHEYTHAYVRIIIVE